MTTKSLMVVGTASSVGKSLLVTAFCRIFKRHGWSVAPFKSQNMSLNSFVTAEGHEIGRAQATQAEAAGLPPSALMNPILLKPTTNKKSQVIVNGQVEAHLSAKEYYTAKNHFIPHVMAAFNTLASRHQAVIIEGAGSPAEINLTKDDFVNMGLAALTGAPVILTGDIDRGGVFAALYGTVKLLPAADQARIKALIINKFRGDLKILEPGLRQIETRLRLPVLGVIPYEKFALDEEDSLTDRLNFKSGPGRVNIAVIQLPHLSNFTDFAALDALPEAALNYILTPAELAAADLIIIPGSKNTIEDIIFLEESGLAGEIKRLAAAGRAICGLCGGFQILGQTIHDPHGLESSRQIHPGLGLLDAETVLAKTKHTVQTTYCLQETGGPLAGTGGLMLHGYEIHHGETRLGPKQKPLAKSLADGSPQGAVSSDGRIFASYLHGFFDNLDFTRRLLAGLRRLKGEMITPPESTITANLPTSYQDLKEREYERLANLVETLIPFNRLLAIMNGVPHELEHLPHGPRPRG
ncbi:MAG: hypothetical protein AMR96_06775 [Candidatus Adiutrix intracellularis]|nr:MAG: hypothetical protein AMR96_06775 [Candidatus Adiutrix intracellularis]